MKPFIHCQCFPRHAPEPQFARLQLPLTIASALTILLTTAGLCFAAPPAPHTPVGGRVVLVAIDKVPWELIAQTNNIPTLQMLMQRGSIGALNLKGFGGSTTQKTAASLSCGDDANAAPASVLMLETDEPFFDGPLAGDAYKRRTGLSPQGAAIVDLGLAEQLALGQKAAHEKPIGTVVSLLNQAGVHCAAFGNSDLGIDPDHAPPDRAMAAAAMGLDGTVEYGAVGKELLRVSPGCPFGVTTSARALVTALKTKGAAANVWVIDLGETGRADAYAPFCLKNHAPFVRMAALRRADRLLAAVLRMIDPQRDLLMVFAPSMPKENAFENGPIIAMGKDIAAGGLLVSRTTRRPGIVTLNDVSATMLSFFSATLPPTVVGREIASVAASDPLRRMLTMNRLSEATDQSLRPGLLGGYGYVASIAFFLAGLMVLAGGGSVVERRWGRWTRLAWALTVIAQPVLLFSPPVTRAVSSQPALAIMALLLLTLIPALFATKRFDLLAAGFPWLAGLTALIVAVDTCCGAHLSLNSIFGYSTFFGGRYYGIGNITMGLTVGATLVIVAAWWDRGEAARRVAYPAALVLMFAVLVLIGHPNFGANVGGVIGAVATFGLMAMKLRGIRVRLGHVIAVVAVVALLLTIQTWLDLRSGAAASSHLGRFMLSIHQEGVAPLLDMIHIKIGVTLRAFKHVHWTVMLIVAWLAWLAAWYGRRDLCVTITEHRPGLRAAVSAAVVGGMISFLVKDSGPATVAAIVVYPLAAFWLPLLVALGADSERAGAET